MGEAVRADYVHADRYASLGLAVLWREPLAFRARADRGEAGGLADALPDAVPLGAVADLLGVGRG